MDEAYERKYHSLEDQHWWFKSRRDILLRLLKTANKNSHILEVGCSGGLLLQDLKSKGFQNVYGIDVSGQTINISRSKGLQNVLLMNAVETGFPDECFDIILASDVLEHLQHDGVALSEWNRLLKPGGLLIIFVPAFSFLWSNHDASNHHYRRYTKAELICALQRAHFQIERCSYWNFTLFFPKSLGNLFGRLISRTNDYSADRFFQHQPSPMVNRFLSSLIRSENMILRMFNLPIGVSVFALSTKTTRSLSTPDWRNI